MANSATRTVARVRRGHSVSLIERSDVPLDGSTRNVRIAVWTILLAALTFNAWLCLANTLVFHTSDAIVSVVQLLIVAAALVLVLDGSVAPILLLAVFFAYMIFIMAMRPGIDAKAVSDFLIPIAFYLLGRRLRDPELIDRIALVSGIIFLIFALFEYFALDTYVKFFNIVHYYVARGTVPASDVTSQTSPLFQSGMRPEARNLLPFLGPHRVSSVFLEPVSAGNFGAILYMWALFRRAARWRIATLLIGVSAVVLSDARFGFYTCICVTLLHIVRRAPPRLVWLVLPFALMLAISIYGYSTAQIDWANNAQGRLLWTAQLLNRLDWAAVFGVAPGKPFLSDSGYAYSLHDIGLVGLVGFWALFLFVRENNGQAWRFKIFAATYLVLIMLISDSAYSIKTAALLWVMVGTMDGWRPQANLADDDETPSEAQIEAWYRREREVLQT
jgi:putative polymerase